MQQYDGECIESLVRTVAKVDGLMPKTVEVSPLAVVEMEEEMESPRNHFAGLAAGSEPGSMFDLLNRLGQALDEHDRLTEEGA